VLQVNRVYPDSVSNPLLYYDECIVRVLQPIATSQHQRNNKGNVSNNNNTTSDNNDNSTTTNHDDEESVVPEEFLDDSAEHHHYNNKDWKAKYRFPIKAVTLHDPPISSQTTVMLHIQLGAVHQHREIVFGTLEDAQAFVRRLRVELEKDGQREMDRLQATAGDVRFLGDNDDVTFLVEICSAWNLPLGHSTYSDPYVKASFQGTHVHQTAVINKTCVFETIQLARRNLTARMPFLTLSISSTRSLDPIWTVKTGSLFLWTVNAKELFLSDGLLCLVLDHDRVGTHKKLASVHIPPQALYTARGERMELELESPRGMENNNYDDNAFGILVVRCRRASEPDVKFMRELEESKTRQDPDTTLVHLAQFATESAGGKGNIASMLAKRSKIVKDKDHPEGIKQASRIDSFVYAKADDLQSCRVILYCSIHFSCCSTKFDPNQTPSAWRKLLG
jgi:hypothetical protein